MSDITDIYDGTHIQLWKDDDGDFQLKVYGTTIALESSTTKEVFDELKKALSKVEDYFAGRSI